MLKRWTTSWILGWLGAFWLLALPVHAASSEDATITVTPAADVSVQLSTTYYNFGPLDVNTSSNSATALTLTNNGEITVTVDKQITVESNPTGWTAGTTAGLDTYVLYAATSTARLSLGEFTAATMFGAQANVTWLTGPSGATPSLPPTGAGQSVDLWFRLDMPTAVSNSTPRAMTIRFTGTAQ